MGSCRILHDTHLSWTVGWEPVRIISKSHNFLFGTTPTPSITFSNSHFFSGQSRHASSPSIVLYLWLGARRPTAGRPKHSHHRQCSNKHYEQKLVQVLLGSGSDGDLVFVDKDKPMLLPSLKRLVPQSWNTSNGRFQTKRKAEIELNVFEYSNSKRYLAAPDIIEYDKINKP